MRRLTTLAMVLAPLVLMAGCGQSACEAHPNGLACEEQQRNHNAAEVENRVKEDREHGETNGFVTIKP
jgi:outer membrane murein-binding lipoprotein Lpp